MRMNSIVAIIALLAIIVGIYVFVINRDVPMQEGMDQPASMTAGGEFLVTSNPDDVTADSVLTFRDDLSSTPLFTGLSGQRSIESSYAQDGDIFVTVDGTASSTGGVLVFDDENEARSLSTPTRMLMGAATLINGPRGIEVSDSLDMIIVSDFGARDIKLFERRADGNVPPAYVIGLGNDTRSVWDTHYDRASDTLYAAGTDGVVLAYEGFSDTFGANGPTRTITPSTNGTKVSVNLHGIAFDASRDTLLLSDVGSATSATDGQLFIVTGASSATGTVNASAVISGPETRLGNPVDIMQSGTSLYVAEKSNDLVMVYEDIFSMTGLLTMAATRSATVLKPESISMRGN
ncbi:MAG: hypothetical protein V4644_01075 [Patescibacteria group bacterium]